MQVTPRLSGHIPKSKNARKHKPKSEVTVIDRKLEKFSLLQAETYEVAIPRNFKSHAPTFFDEDDCYMEIELEHKFILYCTANFLLD